MNLIMTSVIAQVGDSAEGKKTATSFEQTYSHWRTGELKSKQQLYAIYNCSSWKKCGACKGNVCTVLYVIISLCYKHQFKPTFNPSSVSALVAVGTSGYRSLWSFKAIYYLPLLSTSLACIPAKRAPSIPILCGKSFQSFN